MKKTFFAVLLASFVAVAAGAAVAQVPYSSVVPNGYSRKAVVSEQIGITQVTVSYHRPAVNGRENKVWGTLVQKGFNKTGFGPDNPSPWRAGANENTVIEFESDVKIEGQPLPKGKYALFVAYDPAECIVIFSKKFDAWGSFFYDEKDDALRVKVKPLTLDKSVEWLKYEFAAQKDNSATLDLQWEKLSIPVRIEVDGLKQQFDAFVTELKNPGGFTWQGLNVAASWCLTNNYQLEQGLAWANFGIDVFGGGREFSALSTKAQLLNKMGKGDEAAAIMKKALPLGNMSELQQYGRVLLSLKQFKEALDVFKLNYEKNPGQFTTLVGMTRGLSANGDFKQALEFANKALPLAPNDPNRQSVQTMIDKLAAGKDVN
jgi:tetratricopeptide (TPR) repeat protein